MKKYSILIYLGIFWSISTQAHVSLVYPVGSETFKVGETVNIQWKTVIDHATINWDIYFSTDNGASWSVIAEDLNIETFDYNWIVPEALTTEALIKIVQDNPDTDYEDLSAPFTIALTTELNYVSEFPNVKVYPNPLTSHAMLEFSNKENLVYELMISDLQGKVVKRINNFRGEKIMLEKQDLNCGIFIFKLTNSNNISSTGYFIVD